MAKTNEELAAEIAGLKAQISCMAWQQEGIYNFMQREWPEKGIDAPDTIGPVELSYKQGKEQYESNPEKFVDNQSDS